MIPKHEKVFSSWYLLLELCWRTLTSRSARSAGGAKEVIQGFGFKNETKISSSSHWIIFLDLRINKRILPSNLYNNFVLFLYVNPTPEQKPVFDQNYKNIIVDFVFFLIQINNKHINISNHIFEYNDFDGKISRIFFSFTKRIRIQIKMKQKHNTDTNNQENNVLGAYSGEGGGCPLPRICKWKKGKGRKLFIRGPLDRTLPIFYNRKKAPNYGNRLCLLFMFIHIIHSREKPAFAKREAAEASDWLTDGRAERHTARLKKGTDIQIRRRLTLIII